MARRRRDQRRSGVPGGRPRRQGLGRRTGQQQRQPHREAIRAAGRSGSCALLRFVSLMRHPKCLSSTACSLRTVVRRGFTSGLPTRHTPWSANAQTIRRCGLNMSLGLFRHFKGRVSMTASSKTQRTGLLATLRPRTKLVARSLRGGRSMSALSRLAPNRQCLQCAMAEYHRLQLKRFHCSASTPSAASSATIACLRALSSSTAKRCSRRRKSDEAEKPW